VGHVPAVTSRGFKEAEMKQVARWILRVLGHIGDAQIEQEVHGEVLALCQHFPVPGIDS
jgi:glycine hydroxymethyltransferase